MAFSVLGAVSALYPSMPSGRVLVVPGSGRKKWWCSHQVCDVSAPRACPTNERAASTFADLGNPSQKPCFRGLHPDHRFLHACRGNVPVSYTHLRAHETVLD